MDTKKKAGIGAYIAAPLITVLWFIIASLIFTFVLRETSPVPVFLTFAILQFITMILFAVFSEKGKTIVRLTSMFLIGTTLMVMAGILGRSNLQIEGFFFSVLSGTVSGAIVHFAMAKIIGPLLYNRNWCSWGCWTAMFLDLLPYRKKAQWKNGNLPLLRVYHFILSFLLVAGVFYGLKMTVINTDLTIQTGTVLELVWFLSGNVLYYIVGITLALVMKDNRAFCKYICPITILYKTVGRISLLRIGGDSGKCTNCKTCISNCTMSIDIPHYVRNNQRVKSTDCIMCMHCISTCPEAALKATIGLDIAGKNYKR